MSEILIETHTDMLAAVVGVLFTPIEVGSNHLTYDKETIMHLANALDSCFRLWYNVDLNEEMKGIE